MQRARETCELAGFGDKAVIDPDLIEWNYGEYEGLTPEQIHEVAPGWLIFRDGCPGGEAPEQVGARVDRVIARSRAVAGDTALFAHGHVLRVLAARWIGLARERRSALSAEYGHPVCARLLPRNTGRADLERASPRRSRVMIGQIRSWNTNDASSNMAAIDPVLSIHPVATGAHERFRGCSRKDVLW